MNKEQIYDAQIYPLMDEIRRICQAENIAMLCSFSIPTPAEPKLFCTTQITDESGKLPGPLARASRQIVPIEPTRE